MSGSDLEHRIEIRRANAVMPIWIGLSVVAAIVALVVLVAGGGDGDGDEAGGAASTTEPATAPRESLTTTSPRGLPPVQGLTAVGGDRALVAFSTAVAPADGGGLDVDAAQAVVASEGSVVVLAGGRVHAAEPGGSFREVVGCCVEELIPSNEPGHVWLRDEGEVTLLQLEGGGFVTELEVGDGEVLGPASFGVVVLGVDDIVRWHRPMFEPTELQLPVDRQALGSGGERVLVRAPATAGRAARLETWSTTGDGLLQSYAIDEGAPADGLLAPDGSVVAIPADRGWVVRDAATGLRHGLLPEVSAPVWVGGHRFAAPLDGLLVVSDRGAMRLPWPVLAVAEHSP